MKVLLWHCSKYKISNINHSTRMKLIDSNFSDFDLNNVIVPWITIESANDINFLDELIDEIAIMKSIHQTNYVAVTPFGHLSSLHCSRKVAYEILKKLVDTLNSKEFIASMIHFGSYKDLEFMSESHPEQVKFREYPKPHYKL